MLHLRSVTALALVAVGSTVAVALTASVMRAAPSDPTGLEELLDESVGEWEGTMTITRPGMPAMELKATETVTTVGKAWTVSDLRCEVMGQPFHAHHVFGEDETRKQLVAMRVDSMNAQAALMSGRYDETEDVVHMKWTARVKGVAEPVPSRYELRYRGDNYTMRFFEGEGANEFATLTIEMKRKVD